MAYLGELVTLHAEPPLTACAGTGPRLDRVVAFIDSELALGELEQPLNVHWLTRETFDDVAACPTPSGAITVGCHAVAEGVTMLTFVPDEHELVHAYVAAATGPRHLHAFFSEGLAMAYSTSIDTPSPWVPVEDGFGLSTGLPGEFYPRAGHFVGFMISEFGPADVARFVVQVGLSEAEVEAAFSQHFGEPLAEFVARYEAETAGCPTSALQRSSECLAEPTEWPGQLYWEEDFAFDCEDPTVAGMDGLPYPDGVFGSPPPMRYVTHRTIDVNEEQVSGADRFRLEAVEEATLADDAAFRAQLQLCGDCSDHFSFTVDKLNHSFFDVPLVPGRHVLRVSATAPGPENAVTFRMN